MLISGPVICFNVLQKERKGSFDCDFLLVLILSLMPQACDADSPLDHFLPFRQTKHCYQSFNDHETQQLHHGTISCERIWDSRTWLSSWDSTCLVSAIARNKLASFFAKVNLDDPIRRQPPGRNDGASGLRDKSTTSSHFAFALLFQSASSC